MNTYHGRRRKAQRMNAQEIDMVTCYCCKYLVPAGYAVAIPGIDLSVCHDCMTLTSEGR